MAYKMKLSKEDFDALDDGQKALYKSVAGEYILDVDGYEDPVELKRAKQRETQRAKDLQAELDRIKRENDDKTHDDARKSGDVNQLTRSWETKLNDTKAAMQKQLDAANAFIRRTLVQGEAQRIASTISTSPKLLLPHLISRLKVDFTEGEEPKLNVLDAAGKISAHTLDELANEFKTNPDFSSIIIGSKASGSGASADNSHGSGAAPKKFSEMTDQEKTALHRSDPARFDKLSAEAKSELFASRRAELAAK